jgi:hypothetical protein
MPHPLSSLGAVHTILSLVPVIAGLLAFRRHGNIDPTSGLGKIYQAGMIASVGTAFGLSSTGGFNPGHALGLLTLLVMAVATIAPRIALLGRAAAYVQVGLMSFSFMLLLVPGTNETLSRLPAGHPIGHGPDSPPVKLALACVFALFLLGTGYQMLRLRRR